MTTKFPLPIYALFLVAFFVVQDPSAEADDDSIPHIVHKDGRCALFVDGAPYLMLGAR